jgi:hypothetical protein
MNGADTSTAGGEVSRRSLGESFSVDRHRRNKLALIPSRRQNSGTDKPLLDCRANTFNHPVVPRRIRLFVRPIVSSSC